MACGGALIPLAENHLAGSRLQYRSDGDIYRLANHLARVVDHHHRAVIQIGNALVVLFSLFQDEHPHRLARQHDRLQRVGEFVDVQYGHALQLRYFVEIEVVGDDLTFVKFRELNQFHVDFADGGEIIFHDLNLQRPAFLEALQNVETTASSVALQRVGRVGYQLQLPKDKLRDYDDAVKKARFRNVGDAAVDDDTGIEN